MRVIKVMFVTGFVALGIVAVAGALILLKVSGDLEEER